MAVTLYCKYMAQIIVHEGGVVNIGQQIDRQYVKNQYVSAVPEAETETILMPDELKTPFIEERLERLKENGYLDDMHQPVKNKCPWSIASVIAKELGELASISNFYHVFGVLWNHQTLRADYQGFLNNNRKAIEIQHFIHELLV